MDKAFRRARRSWKLDHENKACYIKEHYPVSISFGFNYENSIVYIEMAERLNIDHQVYGGKVWFKNEEDLTAVRICL